MSEETAPPNRNKLGLSAHYFLSFAAIGFTAVFLPLFLRSRGLSLKQVGMLSAIYALAGACAQIPVGILSDKLGSRRPVSVLAAILLGVTYLLFNSARSFGQFFVLYLVGGILFYTVATLTSALISDWTAQTGGTGRFYGNTRIWGSIGFIVTLVIVSAVPGMTKGRNLLPFVAVLFWMSGLAIGSVAEARHHEHRPQPAFRNVPRLLRNRNLALFLLTFFMYRCCEGGGMGFLSIYLNEHLHASRSLISLAFAWNAIIEIPFMIWVGGASDRMGRRPPLVIAFLTLPLRMFLYSQLRHPQDVFFVQLLQGFTFSFMLVPSMAFVADLAPGDLRATGQGLLGMIAGIATSAGPFIGGRIAQYLSISTMYMAIAGTAFVAGMIFILFVHESQPEVGPEYIRSRIRRWHPILRPAVSLLSRPVLGIIRN